MKKDEGKLLKEKGEREYEDVKLSHLFHRKDY